MKQVVNCEYVYNRIKQKHPNSLLPPPVSGTEKQVANCEYLLKYIDKENELTAMEATTHGTSKFATHMALNKEAIENAMDLILPPPGIWAINEGAGSDQVVYSYTGISWKRGSNLVDRQGYFILWSPKNSSTNHFGRGVFIAISKQYDSALVNRYFAIYYSYDGVNYNYLSDLRVENDSFSQRINKRCIINNGILSICASSPSPSMVNGLYYSIEPFNGQAHKCLMNTIENCVGLLQWKVSNIDSDCFIAISNKGYCSYSFGPNWNVLTNFPSSKISKAISPKFIIDQDDKTYYSIIYITFSGRIATAVQLDTNILPNDLQFKNSVLINDYTLLISSNNGDLYKNTVSSYNIFNKINGEGKINELFLSVALSDTNYLLVGRDGSAVVYSSTIHQVTSIPLANILNVSEYTFGSTTYFVAVSIDGQTAVSTDYFENWQIVDSIPSNVNITDIYTVFTGIQALNFNGLLYKFDVVLLQWVLLRPTPFSKVSNNKFYLNMYFTIGIDERLYFSPIKYFNDVTTNLSQTFPLENAINVDSFLISNGDLNSNGIVIIILKKDKNIIASSNIYSPININSINSIFNTAYFYGGEVVDFAKHDNINVGLLEGGDIIYSTTYGKTWGYSKYSHKSSYPYYRNYKVIYGRDKFVATNSDTIIYSYDGFEWFDTNVILNIQNDPSNYNALGNAVIVYIESIGRFFCYYKTTSYGLFYVWNSYDGINWYKWDNYLVLPLDSVTYGDDKIVTVKGTYDGYYSYDGYHWYRFSHDYNLKDINDDIVFVDGKEFL